LVARTTWVGTATLNEGFSVADANSPAGGWLGYAQITSNSANFNTTLTDISGLSQAVTVNSNRRIKVTVDFSVELDANAAVNFFIREGSTVLRGMQRAWGSTGAADHIHFHVVLTPTSGSHTYKLSASRAPSGGNNVWVVASTDAPASILIEDLGPSS
jgi:hypothetical protein